MLGHVVHRVLSHADLDARRTGRHLPPSHPFRFDAEEGPRPLEAILTREGPFHYVINCIGVLASGIDPGDPASIGRAIRVNAMFPQELAQVSCQTGVRVIHVSSDGVFPAGAGTCTEDTPASSLDPYGRSKALGEAVAPEMLVLRCSIIGPDPRGRRGLVERLLSLPTGGRIDGYTDHRWNGVTSVQFADVCGVLAAGDAFGQVRREAAVHHFCPNAPVTKYELLRDLAALFRPDVVVRGCSGPTPVTRVLDTRYATLRRLFGHGRPMADALQGLATELSLSTQ